MTPRLTAVVTGVLQKSAPGLPADAALRQALKLTRGLTEAEKTGASHAVFSYYRWLKWLNPMESLSAQVYAALGLAAVFGRDPSRIPDEDLLAKAIPDWIHNELTPTPAWARSLQTEPRLWLRAKRGRAPELAAKLGDCARQLEPGLEDVLEYTGTADLFRTPEFHAGLFEVQDISSQTVGLVCSPKPDEKWWDVCAGEGGKTLHFSELMRNRGIIWATDRAGWRLNVLKRRAGRAGAYNYRLAVWEGGASKPLRTRFDGVLVDAPCSGVGTWQRNPHARWTTTQRDVTELQRLQQTLLTSAAGSVKPGGKLIYSACTLTRSETTEVAQHVDSTLPDFQRLHISNPLRPDAAPVQHLELWPQDHGGNGMFIAAWTRVQEPSQ